MHAQWYTHDTNRSPGESTGNLNTFSQLEGSEIDVKDEQVKTL
jgi:hypothetical protein